MNPLPVPELSLSEVDLEQIDRIMVGSVAAPGQDAVAAAAGSGAP